MKKLLIVVLALVCFASVSEAQKKKMFISGGAEISLPQGDFGDAFSMGFGATAAFELVFSPQLHGIATAGYLMWSPDNEPANTDISFSSIPILGGVKYYFDKKGGFYVLGQAGFYMSSSTIEVGGVEVFDDSGSDFAVRAGGGYEMPLGKKAVLDISAFYVMIEDANNIGARVAAKFPL
ncbi:outer membrane beta-barrel protein [Bacteroidota bacterium]